MVDTRCDIQSVLIGLYQQSGTAQRTVDPVEQAAALESRQPQPKRRAPAVYDEQRFAQFQQNSRKPAELYPDSPTPQARKALAAYQEAQQTQQDEERDYLTRLMGVDDFA